MDVPELRKDAFALPSGISLDEAAAVAEALRMSTASRPESEGKVELVEIRALGIQGPGAADILLIVSGLAGAWFTKKWVDEYVWPLVKRRIDRPSKILTEWLERTVASLAERNSKDDKDPR
jgi:hypothetical protein